MTLLTSAVVMTTAATLEALVDYENMTNTVTMEEASTLAAAADTVVTVMMVAPVDRSGRR